MVRRLCIPLVATTSLWLGWQSAARACSCIAPKPPLVAADRAAAVFEARAGIASPHDHGVVYPFDVLRVFKGDIGEQVEIYTAGSSAACGRSFHRGRTYIVYAYDLGGGRLGDGLCTRTRLSSRAAEDLAALGPGREVGVATEPVDDDEPTSELPRIEPQPAQVQPSTPKSGRCSASELPHERRRGLIWVLLLVAGRRRRALR